MIYLDQAATSWPKPRAVIEAVSNAMLLPGGNLGRSSYQVALKMSEVAYECRENLARLFGVANPLRICLTANATEALNIALKGFLKPGDHVICSSMEHNAVWRPLVALSRRGIEFSIAQADADGVLSVESILSQIRPNTCLIAVLHASNVNGAIQPIAAIGAAARERNIAFLVDASQTAGALPIDVERMKIDMLAFPGHKALLGPQGTGGLYVCEKIELEPLKEGGTGSESQNPLPPVIMPDRLETGTMNLPGIAGLNQAVRYILERGVNSIAQHERDLCVELREGLRSIRGVTVHCPPPQLPGAAVVSFNVHRFDPTSVAEELDRQFGIACRSGLHCAWLAHQSLGTAPLGTVRLSLGPFTMRRHIHAALRAVKSVEREASA